MSLMSQQTKSHGKNSWLGFIIRPVWRCLVGRKEMWWRLQSHPAASSLPFLCFLSRYGNLERFIGGLRQPFENASGNGCSHNQAKLVWNRDGKTETMESHSERFINESDEWKQQSKKIPLACPRRARENGRGWTGYFNGCFSEICSFLTDPRRCLEPSKAAGAALQRTSSQRECETLHSYRTDVKWYVQMRSNLTEQRRRTIWFNLFLYRQENTWTHTHAHTRTHTAPHFHCCIFVPAWRSNYT